jgi:hypothetical protein
MAEDDPLRELIEAVADGTLERKRLPGTHRDPTISQLLAELQILAGVSEVHRSQVAGDEPGDEPTTATSAPGSLVQPTPPTGPSSGPVDVPLSPGTQWGNFELVRKVGEGTFGEVFLARDLWLGHDVALKLLKANVTDRARMLHEARMLVRVRHLNVVMVHGADVHGGRMGFWMDFVEGATLDAAIRREGPRSASEAFAWGQDLCRALAAVHGAGIVHRDVKAQNVMRRTSDGRLVLMDFGAGELLGTKRAGAAAGTPMYLAPELLHGAEASRSSDIYALGVLLFFLVSRKFPVQAASWEELVAAHQRKERVRLEDVRPDMPSAFVDVVERALRPDPSQRYASAGEMLAAMRGGGDSGPLYVTPAPSPTPKPLPPWWQQTALRVGTVAGGVVAIALGLGFVASGAFRVFLRVPQQFDSGGLNPVWGIRPMVPVLFYWGYLLFVLATLIGLAMLAGALVNGLAARALGRERYAAARARFAASTAMAAFIAASIFWFAWTWSQSTGPLAALALGIAWAVGLPLLVVTAGSMSAPHLVRDMADATAVRRLNALIQPAPNSVLRAATIFSLAAASWLLVVWWQASVFGGLVALTNLPIDGADVGPLFAPLDTPHQRFYVQACAFLSFALAFAIWYVRRVEPPGPFEPVRFMRWSLVALFMSTLGMTALPYRIAWQDFERVDYAGTPAFIVGETADQYHLFFPPSTGAVGRNVQRDDARLTHSGVYGKLFVERLGH